ncbi:hypothetical protein A9Q84_06920 [Halobacteriovorax marinus]|uniref:Thiamine diphosphokinase n=1 Tax=Halobacteriovorax marinus TaxID=97084 RepID=A0A1Y5F9W1_9BACT|nr:hypothetical protein A9Q84_06920 [Halobacteriovorax marinus]
MNSQSKLDSITQAKELLLIGPCPFKADHLYQDALTREVPIIAVDKGLEHCPLAPVIYAIGDGDSSKLPMDHKLPCEKNQSDLNAALNLISKNTKHISLHGFLGLRRDHEWINLGEIYHFIKNSKCIAKIDQNCLIIPKGRTRLEIQGTFSLMSLYQTQLKIVGQCKYQLKDFTELSPLSSHGLSNEGSGMVEIESKEALILYFQEEVLKFPQCDL